MSQGKAVWTAEELQQQIDVLKNEGPAHGLPPEFIAEAVEAFELCLRYLKQKGVTRASREELNTLLEKAGKTIRFK